MSKRKEPPPAFIPTVAFALGVVEHPTEKKWVLVHEKKDRGWWLPGGGVDAKQTFSEAMVRESEEEAGCAVNVSGILRVEHSPCGDHDRLRVIYLCCPVDPDVPLKSIPDEESKGAAWTDLGQLRAIAEGTAAVEDCHLRGDEPLEWFSHRSHGGHVAPLAFLRQTRLGSPAEEAQGEAERAFYPSSKSVGVAVMMTGAGGMREAWLPQHPQMHLMVG